MVGGARQISANLADKGISTYNYRFSYVPESLQRDSASHASDIPFFMNTQQQNTGTRRPRGQCGGKGHQQLRREIRQGRSKEPTDRGWPRYQRRDGKMMDFSRQGTADLIDDPWAAEIDAAPPARYPGMSVGGAAGRGGGRGGQ